MIWLLIKRLERKSYFYERKEYSDKVVARMTAVIQTYG